MSRTIHGLSHKAIAPFRKCPASLAVYWIYVSRMNNEGVAWPSGASLAKTTGWNKGACLDGRGFLVEHEALELVKGYIRPEWRKLDAITLKRKLTLDRSEYYRPTGYIMLPDGESTAKFWMLYNGGDEASEIDSTVYDGQPRRPSAAAAVVGSGSRPNTPELDSSIELDSTLQLDSNLSSLASKQKKEILSGNAKEWKTSKQMLEIQLNQNTFMTWIKDVEYLREEAGNVWVFQAPTTFARDYLQHRLMREIKRVVRDVHGSPVELVFESAVSA